MEEKGEAPTEDDVQRNVLKQIVDRNGNVIRSPADTDEYGPASMPRHQASTRARSRPVAIWGRAMPMSIRRI